MHGVVASSEPCLEPATVRWFDEVARRAEKADVGCLKSVGEVFRAVPTRTKWFLARSQPMRRQWEPRGRCNSLLARPENRPKSNTGGGNRTHTGVPAQRILSSVSFSL